MSKELNRLLIVDQAEDSSRQYSRIGGRAGYSTATADSLAEFRDALERFVPTVVLIDLPSTGSDGVGHLKAMRDNGCDALVALIGEGDLRSLETAKQLAEVLGLPAVASARSPAIVDVLRNELQKARQSANGATSGELRMAIARGEVRPCYRPRASYKDVQGWPITDVEALPRWHLGETDIAMPEDFYGLAEQGSLLPAVTKSLLEQVVVQMREWRNALNVVVGLPAPSLADGTLPDFLLGRLRDAGIEPSRFTLEVAESLAMGYSRQATDNLRRLKAMGFRLGIDEFGTGYSSLEQLCRLKFDELKVDGSLVQETRVSGEARTILEATVALAHRLGLTVCADGVDSERALNYLGRIGCDAAQGDHIGRPSSARSLEARLREWNAPVPGARRSLTAIHAS